MSGANLANHAEDCMRGMCSFAKRSASVAYPRVPRCIGEGRLAADMRIIGIGASAAGNGALPGFFQHVPPRNGIACGVVPHLAPDHPSMLAAVLGNWPRCRCATCC
jgi:chemotaxis response regulator CheB